MLPLSILSVIGESVAKNKGVSILLLVLSIVFVMIDSVALPRLTVEIVSNITNIKLMQVLLLYSVVCFIVRSMAQAYVDSKINILYDSISNNLLTRLIGRIHMNYETDISKLDTTVMTTYYEKMNSSIIDLVSNMKYRKIAIIIITTVFLNYAFYNSIAFGALSTLVLLILVSISVYTLNTSTRINDKTEKRRNRFLGVFADYINNMIPIYTHGTNIQEQDAIMNKSYVINEENQKNMDEISYRRIVMYVLFVVTILGLLYALVRYFPSIKSGPKSTLAILIFSLLVQFGHFSIYFIPTVEQMSRYGSIQREMETLDARDSRHKDDDERSYYPPSSSGGVVAGLYGNLRDMSSNVYQNIKSNVAHPLRIQERFGGADADADYSVRARDVTYRDIIQGKSLDIGSGERVAIMGEIGCGKSTFIKCVGRFLPIHGGAIYVGGRNIHDPSYPIHSYRRMIGYVPQHISLFNRSIYENIFYGTNMSDHQKRAVLDELNVESILGDLSRPVGINGANVSGGQRQLIYVIRNIIHPDKRILLLDEPTISLDADTKGYMLDLFRRTKGKTLIIITHDADCIKVVDRVIQFEKSHTWGGSFYFRSCCIV